MLKLIIKERDNLIILLEETIVVFKVAVELFSSHVNFKFD